MVSTENSLFSYDDNRKDKAPNALRTISEASDMLDVPQHVLRFWETKFSQIKPLKRNGGRRFYRPQDLDVLQQIKHLLYSQGYTIKGAKKAVDDFIHARAIGATANSSEWLASVPPASVNDNHSFEELDVLADIALALAEPVEENVVALPTAATTAQSREALQKLRSELVEAKSRLRAHLPGLVSAA